MKYDVGFKVLPLIIQFKTWQMTLNSHEILYTQPIHKSNNMYILFAIIWNVLFKINFKLKEFN